MKTKKQFKVLQYNVVFRPEPEGGYTVFVPSLPGCITYGKDVAEAAFMVEDAIKCYVESLKKHNEHIPTDEGNLAASIRIQHKENTKRRAYA